jgi:hypothetical protein
MFGIIQTPLRVRSIRQANAMNPSVRTIIELNIQHYRNLLKTTTDVSKRQTIARLLAAEEAKLLKLSAQTKKEDDKDGSSI